MPKVQFDDTEFDSVHEANCAALFKRYGWKYEKPRKGLAGWFPDIVLKGDTTVQVECKGNVEWDDVKTLDLTKYTEAVRDSHYEVLLIPKEPRREKNSRGFVNSFLGYLYDGDVWSYAALSTWSGRVGFCHNANSWKDRMSGQNIQGSLGDGQSPDINRDWSAAKYALDGKAVSFFKRDVDSDTEVWEPPS